MQLKNISLLFFALIFSACSKTNTVILEKKNSNDSPPVINKLQTQDSLDIIQPFGDFKWGDDFETVLTKVCSIETIRTLGMPNAEIPKQKACDQITNADFFIDQEVKASKCSGICDEFGEAKSKESAIISRVGDIRSASMFEGVKLSDNTKIDITAQPVNIKGVDYVLRFRLDDAGNPKGAYLSMKNRAINVMTPEGSITSPAALTSLTLIPIDKEKASANVATTYDAIHSKYEFYKGTEARYVESKDMSEGFLVEYEGTQINFETSNTFEIIYRGDSYLSKKFTKLSEDFQKSEINKNSKKDSSSSL